MFRLQGKLNKKLYLSFREFVRDVAQICHNAQVYNRPSAPIFGAAEGLRQVFKAELKRLADKGLIKPDEAELPNLGELPPAEESVDEDEDEGDEDDADEEEEDEESEEDEGEEEVERIRSRGRLRARTSTSQRATGGGEDDEHKKRGRPPTLLTPTEARITAMLKGLRKLQDDEGNPLVADFDKLPDKTMFPDYYEVIENPIALDTIKKKMKRKKYANVDDALRDLNLMFENAQTYNEDDSDIYDAAVRLRKQARVLAAQERARPDDDFRDEEGKLPLAEVLHNGETYKIGAYFLIHPDPEPPDPDSRGERGESCSRDRAPLANQQRQATGCTFVMPTTPRSRSSPRYFAYGRTGPVSDGSTPAGTIVRSRRCTASTSSSSTTRWPRRASTATTPLRICSTSVSSCS